MVPIAIRPVLQLSVTDAVPKAAAIWAEVGLHPSVVAVVSRITGFIASPTLRSLSRLNYIHNCCQP
jgi:hypothetical protein